MIDKQLQLEEDMVCRGQAFYREQQSKLIERGEGHSTAAAKRLTRSLVLDAADVLASRIPTGPGRRAPYVKFLQKLDLKRCSLIAVRTMFGMVHINPTIQDVALQIGSRVEDDLLFDVFEQAHKEYYDKIIDTLSQRQAHSYRHQHKALRHGAMEKDVSWEAWSVVDKVNLGLVMMDAVCGVSDVFDKEVKKHHGKASQHLTLSDEGVEWVTKCDTELSLMRPAAAPLVVPPRKWDNIWDGGYHSAHMAHRFPLIKVKDKAHRKALAAYKDWENTLAAVNNWQSHPWAVNGPVLDVMTEVYQKGLGIGLPSPNKIAPPPFPLADDFDKDTASDEDVAKFMRWKREATLAYSAENERRGRCIQFVRGLQMAREYVGYPAIYFTYQADFRGRFYCTSSGLNPQGNDTSKALLVNGARRAIGSESGAAWFRVHGSNLYGVDKVSFTDRVKWTTEHHAAICESANDPIGQREFWGNADSPWQFLAFCFEYAAWANAGFSLDFATNLTVALDGTCNGLQHFSAMLRDAVGGAAVNLVDHDKPSDIYGIVAELVEGELRGLAESGDACAVAWLSLGITRKLTKRPVMTLPYGSTRTSCREYIEDFLYESDKVADVFPGYHDKYRASQWLTPIVWDCMRRTLTAAMEAMGWLQDRARQLGNRQQFPEWVSPSGFLAVQRACEYDIEIIKTQLLGSLAVNGSYGRTKVSIGTPSERVNKRRNANSIAPNFVHSCDAAHMVLTTLEFGDRFMWLVHDSYGAHPADCDDLAAAIRSTFHDMYQACWLTAFAKHNQLDIEETPVPPTGDLDLSLVKSATYFFG